MTDGRDEPDGQIHLAFDRGIRTIAISSILPLKSLPDGARESRKFAQVLSSIKAIGLVEAPVVIADSNNPGNWFLLDGHLRIEALKELGILMSSASSQPMTTRTHITSGSTGWLLFRNIG